MARETKSRWSLGREPMEHLLSETAKVDTKPQLEIFADDVKCTHGATVGSLDAVPLFYCQSRGIAMEDAVSMIVNGFCKEVFRELPMEFAVEAQKLLSISIEGSLG